MSHDPGQTLHRHVTALYPICRSITGDGLRQTLRYVAGHIPLTTHEVPSGTKVLDWEVPAEWNVRGAFIATPGRRPSGRSSSMWKPSTPAGAGIPARAIG